MTQKKESPLSKMQVAQDEEERSEIREIRERVGHEGALFFVSVRGTASSSAAVA
jgi:hypothetical protein